MKNSSRLSTVIDSQKAKVEECKKMGTAKDKLVSGKEYKTKFSKAQYSKLTNRYRKLKEERKLLEAAEMSSISVDIEKFPDLPSDRRTSGGCVPSIPNKKDEQFETFETDISALNISLKSKTAMRLKKLIKTSFGRTGKAPDSTSDFYRIGKVLGRGAFGKVSLTVHRLSEEMIAIKSINKEYLTDDSSRQKVMKEVKILKRMRHTNIVQLLDTFETSKHIIFVMELCSGGDLLNYVRKRRKLTEDYAKTIFKQILDALHYCHKLNILHRDIKLDNIILDAEGVIKVGDFGVSKIVDNNQTMYDQCGTPAYIAPEILRDKGYKGYGIDVWSAGVVLYAMLYGTVPFRAQNMSELHDMIVKAKFSLKPEISEQARDLIKKILEPDPRKRLTIPQIIKHPWFDDLKEDLEMFTDLEKEKLKEEFAYNDVKKQYKNNDTDVS
jgi:serine/threonine protein kinase